MKNHNMSVNMIDLETPLREALKEFLDSNYDLKVKVTGYAKHSSSYFPVVEFKTFDSVSGEETLNRYEQYDDIIYEVNIYAKTIEKEDGEVRTEVEIANDLKILVNNFLDNKVGMKRTMCQVSPNLDLDIYRIIMRFSCSYNRRRNNFIRR